MPLACPEDSRVQHSCSSRRFERRDSVCFNRWQDPMVDASIVWSKKVAGPSERRGCSQALNDRPPSRLALAGPHPPSCSGRSRPAGSCTSLSTGRQALRLGSVSARGHQSPSSAGQSSGFSRRLPRIPPQPPRIESAEGCLFGTAASK